MNTFFKRNIKKIRMFFIRKIFPEIYENIINNESDNEKMKRLMKLVNKDFQPNMNILNERLRNIDFMALSIKAMGYNLARSLVDAWPTIENKGPIKLDIGSKLCTQADIESIWSRHWFSELGIPLIYHRKAWEFSYVLQTLYNSGNIDSSKTGLGFGCGREPIASYLASKGVKTTITDLLPDDAQSAGWRNSNQHVDTIEEAHLEHLVDKETFKRLVSHRYVDMNAIPDDLNGYDFCWSICALEHLGSIQLGLDFIEASLRTLRPGGVAVHTMEFNINPEGPTIDNWPTVLFQKKHIEELARQLEGKGTKSHVWISMLEINLWINLLIFPLGEGKTLSEIWRTNSRLDRIIPMVI